jgi:hypothetical protein
MRKKPIAHVSPTLYGLMTEEINHSYDGGLYPELIRNRAFMDRSYGRTAGCWSSEATRRHPWNSTRTTVPVERFRAA